MLILQEYRTKEIGNENMKTRRDFNRSWIMTIGTCEKRARPTSIAPPSLSPYPIRVYPVKVHIIGKLFAKRPTRFFKAYFLILQGFIYVYSL